MKINFQEVRKSPEYTSAVIRYGFWLISSLFIGLAMYTDYYEPVWEFYGYFSVSFFVYTTIVFISILYVPRVSYRPYLTIPMDVCAISIAMLFTDDGPFSPFFLFYAWYFVSYSLRYGRGPLFAAAIVSVIAFLVVLALTDGWYSHVYDVIMYLIFLVIMPVYLDLMLKKINKARDEANQANKAKSDFLAAMSHEIRTPMSGIVGVTNLLEKTSLNADQREYVLALQESSTALNALIDDVLDLSKIEAGKYSLEDERFNLPKTLYGVAQMFTASAHDKGLELLLDYAPELPEYVSGDGKRLRQIVLNLVSNAIKFTEHGHVVIRVSLSRQQDVAGMMKLRFEVEDTGAGLSNEQIQRIFDPFYQVNEKRPQQNQSSGTGLGTTISANLVELMRGQIGVESRQGQGSTFWFEIPFHYEMPLETPTADSASQPLIALETHALNREILERYCLGIDWPCTVCADRDALFDAIESAVTKGTRPVVMISALKGGKQAVDIARQVRERYASLKLCKIIHLCDLHSITDDERSLFDYFLSLPLTPQRVRKALMTLAGMISESDEETNQTDLGATTISRFLNILVAEDSPINAKVIKTFLEQDGHRVTHVENGKQAVEALKDDTFDIVFMDMRMPEMDGLEATRTWRATELDDQHVPIIALTANATPEDKSNCLSAGMDAFLSKPVSLEELRHVLDRSA